MEKKPEVPSKKVPKQETQRERGFIEEAPSNHPIYNGSYRIGQKTLKDFAASSQEQTSPEKRKKSTGGDHEG